jgi:uncharacterized glyoxalase superfamily protein PhnB
MISYVTLGSNDTEKALAFYGPLLAEMGAEKVLDTGRLHAFSTGPGQPMLLVGAPWDGESASNGNGTMVAIAVGSRENVDKMHAKALELGASDEGAPGERMAGFYGGYFRDLDKNKVVFCHFG